MPVGIMQSSLDSNRLAGSFEMAAEAGAEGIVLVCETGKHVSALLSDEGVAQVINLKDEFSLAVPGIALPVLSETESLFGKPEVAEAAKTLIREAMARAVQIGTDVVGLVFARKAAIELEDELDRVIEALDELAGEAEDNALTLGIEAGLNVNQQLYLLDHLGAYRSVKACYDTGIILARKLDPVSALRDLGRDHICQIHLRDVRLAEASPPDWSVALGEGDVDFPAVANAIAALGYEGWTIVETPPAAEPLAAAKANLKFARDLLA